MNKTPSIELLEESINTLQRFDTSLGNFSTYFSYRLSIVLLSVMGLLGVLVVAIVTNGDPSFYVAGLFFLGMLSLPISETFNASLSSSDRASLNVLRVSQNKPALGLHDNVTRGEISINIRKARHDLGELQILHKQLQQLGLSDVDSKTLFTLK